MNTKNLSNPKVASYVEHFSSKTITELVELLNAQIGLNAWASERAYYIEGLLLTIQNKGINVDAIVTNDSVSLAKKVTLSSDSLVMQD